MHGDGPVDLRVESDDGSTVVWVAGELDIASVPALRDALFRAVDGPGDVVLDVSDVVFCDASTLAVLVNARNRARARGGRLVVRHPPPAMRRVIDVTRLDGILDVEE